MELISNRLYNILVTLHFQLYINSRSKFAIDTFNSMRKNNIIICSFIFSENIHLAGEEKRGNIHRNCVLVFSLSQLFSINSSRWRSGLFSLQHLQHMLMQLNADVHLLPGDHRQVNFQWKRYNSVHFILNLFDEPDYATSAVPWWSFL